MVILAAKEFNICDIENIVVSVNGAKIKSNLFKGVASQYLNVPTFQIDITIKGKV